jgi:hypothetical protein
MAERSFIPIFPSSRNESLLLMLQGKLWNIILKHGLDAWVYSGDDWRVRNA